MTYKTTRADALRGAVGAIEGPPTSGSATQVRVLTICLLKNQQVSILSQRSARYLISWSSIFAVGSG